MLEIKWKYIHPEVEEAQTGSELRAQWILTLYDLSILVAVQTSGVPDKGDIWRGRKGYRLVRAAGAARAGLLINHTCSGMDCDNFCVMSMARMFNIICAKSFPFDDDDE